MGRDPKAFLRTARELGFLEAAQHEELLARIDRAANEGRTVPIRELLFETGLLRGDQVSHLLATEDGTASAPVNVDADRSIRLQIETEELIGPAGGPVVERLAARFDIGEVLGQGGAGEVHLATDRFLRREVAIKRLKRGDRIALRRFIEEAQITSQLEHPAIPPVYEYGIEPGTGSPYLVLKRLRGRSLLRVLEDVEDGWPTRLRDPAERETPEETLASLLEVFVKASQAVAYAHSRGVVHRDLKPANIMVGDYGEVGVIDWGLAKPVGGADPGRGGTVVTDRTDGKRGGQLTLAGRSLGTPRYMAPEQIEMDPTESDLRTDIYGLGAVLYRVVSLVDPVPGDTRREVMRRIRKGQIPAPSERSKAAWRVPAMIDRIVLQAMAPRLDERYQTVGELIEDVEALRVYRLHAEGGGSSGSGERPIPAGRRSTVRSRALRRRPVPGLAILAGISAGLGVIGILFGLIRSADLDGRIEEAVERRRASQESWTGAELGRAGVEIRAGAWLESERARAMHPDPPATWLEEARERLDALEREALTLRRWDLVRVLLQAAEDGEVIGPAEVAVRRARCARRERDAE